MHTLYSVATLIFFGFIARVAALYALNLAGLPGALVAQRDQKSASPRVVVGTALALLGQSYVYLAYSAFIVNWTQYSIYNRHVSPYVMWPTAFLTVMVPILRCSFVAIAEGESDNYTATSLAQVNALSWTVFLAAIGFLIFIFIPASTRWMFPWEFPT